MFAKYKQQPITSVPVFIEETADRLVGKVKALWPAQQAGEREIVVEQPRTYRKRIKVTVRINEWRMKLAEHGKRPLGAIRRCDNPTNVLDLRILKRRT